MRYEMTTRNGEPAIRVRLNYDEMREYLALDEEWIEVLDSLTASERRAATLELYLVPLREVAEYAVGTAGKPTEHLPALRPQRRPGGGRLRRGPLYSGRDRPSRIPPCPRPAARIIAREIRAWDTEDIYRLMELLAKLGEIVDRAGREVGVLCAGGVAPLRPDSGGGRYGLSGLGR